MGRQAGPVSMATPLRKKRSDDGLRRIGGVVFGVPSLLLLYCRIELTRGL